jgi:hypothetical protein
MAEEGNVDQQTVEQLRDILQGIPGDDLATLRAAAAAAIDAVPDSAKADVATAAVGAVPDSAKADIATAAVEAVPASAKAGVITAAIDAVPDSAKVGVATAAVGAVPDSARPAVAATALENLSEGQRQALLPTQRVTDQVWLMIVGAFALVFVLSALALFWAAYLDLANAQMLLTVVTTVAGVLAGFVGGRSAAPGANGPPSQ